MFFFLILGAKGCEKNIEFSECVDGTMAVFVNKEGCSEKNVSKSGIKCDFTCEGGKILSFDEEKMTPVCQTCPEGSYSLGGGEEYLEWDELTDNFHAFCWIMGASGWEIREDCTSWHSNSENVLVTGTGPESLWYETDLLFYPYLVKEGYVEITYRKEAIFLYGSIIGDFFVFIDDEVKLYDFDIENSSWKIVNFTLTKGLHKVEITFDKLTSSQLVYAQIRNIKIVGTQFFDTECIPCKNGFSAAGSKTCLYCEAGTFLDTTRNECQDCPEGTVSYPGSSSIDHCTAVRPCDRSDYYFYFSECVLGKQKKIYEWNPILACNNSDFSLPDIEEIDCRPCGPGRVYSSNLCDYCPTGSFSLSGGYSESCQPCPAGSYAPKELNYADWSELPRDLKTYCIESHNLRCDYKWEARGDHLISSPIYTNNTKVVIEGVFEITHPGSFISFQYSVKGKNSEFSFYVNKRNFLSESDCNNRNFSVSLPIGQNTAKWVCFHKNNNGESCEIFKVSVNGTQNGGAGKCVACPAGLASNGSVDICQRCPLGLTLGLDNANCKPCPSGMFISANGKCLPCPSGLSDLSGYCVLLNDSITVNSSTFMLKNFSGPGKPPFYCTEQKLKTHCFDSFYGPVKGENQYFYLSILNPSHLLMPSFSKFSEDKGYVFGVFDPVFLGLENSNLTKSECSLTSSKIVANLGKELEITQENSGIGDGFRVEYRNGDACGKSNFFSIIHFVCSKEEEEGWPVFLGYSDCGFRFVWANVHGCEVCKEEMVVTHYSKCYKGKQKVTYFEGKNCVFEDRARYRTKEIDCEFSSVYKTWPFIIGVVLLTILVVVVLTIVFFAWRKRNGYRRLVQYVADSKSSRSNA